MGGIESSLAGLLRDRGPRESYAEPVVRCEGVWVDVIHVQVSPGIPSLNLKVFPAESHDTRPSFFGFGPSPLAVRHTEALLKTKRLPLVRGCS